MEFHRVLLGPRIYCMYTKPVSDIIERHGLSHHSYADDTQLYMTMDHSNNDWRDGLARIELCVSEIRKWMNQNMLKLNQGSHRNLIMNFHDFSMTICHFSMTFDHQLNSFATTPFLFF